MLLYRTQHVRSAVEDEAIRQERERMLMTAEAISLLAAHLGDVSGPSRGTPGHHVADACAAASATIYYQSLVVCIVLSVIVGIRAAVYVQYPKPVVRRHR